MLNKSNINKKNSKTRVLIAPLDWGLGHTTRCIPIITKLLATGFEVILAAENASAALLTQEFPTLKILPLKGYDISYSKKNALFYWKLLMQFPKILRTIKYENVWLNKIIKEYNIDIVLSDNRFGLYNKNATSIFITHQLTIKFENRIIEKLAQKVNYFFINKFDKCWIPDAADESENFAGVLSHPIVFPRTPIAYIGALSRFETTSTIPKLDVLILLSGPEPQRSIFEKNIIAQLKNLPFKIALVRGLPLSKNELIIDGVKIYNHLPAYELSELILASSIIVARSGYTTVMDIAKLQKKAIFVPTPSQTEQVYLAKYLAEKKYCIYEKQVKFNLSNALKTINNTRLLPYPTLENESLSKAINSLL